MKLNVFKEHNKKILYIYTIDDQDLIATHSVTVLRLGGVVYLNNAWGAIIKEQFIIVLIIHLSKNLFVIHDCPQGEYALLIIMLKHLFCQDPNKPRQKFIVRRCRNVLHYCGGKCILKRGSEAAPPLIISCCSEFVTVDELELLAPVHHIPHKIFLKYAISESVAELVDDCIQSRLSGVGLPSTIKDLNEVITQCADVVAVQINICHVVAVNNFSVTRAPVFAVGDGAVHLLFDLTHESRCCVDSYKMTQKNEGCNQ